MLKDKKRYTIAVLVSGILDEFTKYVCKGVLQGARSADVNVVVVPGKYLDRDLSGNRELFYEYQYGTVFSYLNKENADALIVAAGSIGCFTSKKRMEEMLRQFAGIPCVLLASQLDGYPHVVFDNFQGIREGMEYLIRQKGCTKFGMIGGNEENEDAYARKQAFIRILKNNGIPFSEKMYAEGDLSRRCTQAFRQLLDNYPEVEAVFCVNDETTIGLYEELKRRGLKAGRDLYVFGYDDAVAAAKANPSLSSVRADSGKLGEEALRMALRLIREGRVENSIVPTRFVKRDSVNRMAQDEGPGSHASLDGLAGFEDVFYWYLHEEAQDQLEQLRSGYGKMMHALLQCCRTGVYAPEERLEVLRNVEEFLSLGGTEYADMDNFLGILEDVYHMLLGQQADDAGRFALRSLFASVYKKFILEMNHQTGRMKEEKEAESYAMKLFVQNIMQWENGKDQSYGSLLSNLEWLHISNACIYMLKEPVLHLFREEFQAPGEVYLKAVLKQGEIHTLLPDQQRQEAGAIFENPYLPAGQRFERILLPLFFNENVYGVLLCDMNESLFLNGEFLVNQISAAIRMLQLLQTNERIQQQLEENLAAIKEHNIELDHLSRSDMLTGILNRRGFYDEARRKLQQYCAGAKKVLVLYVDMNNLKIINDRYGHEEGDFSLQAIGSILVKLAGTQGIAGRIGGDEYACVLEYAQEDSGEHMLAEIHRAFEAFNAASGKPYNVTVSAGVCAVQAGEDISLEEALARADDRLYVEKQNRKKEVAKTAAAAHK